MRRRLARAARGAGVILAGAAASLGAQAGGRDTARTVIIDSVQKVYLSDSARRGQALAPPADDLARTLDAEMRVAVFELTAGREMAALSRLERAAALAGQEPGADRPERAALRFLLAQSYYRLGMADAFRAQADSLLALTAGARFAPVLRSQLLVEAYRRGDHARAAELARAMPGAESSELAPVIAGLAAYQAGNMAEARAAFQRAGSAAGPAGLYARYMDALAQLRGDTANATGALASLERLAGAATGPFADQVRLTAAQVAYESERYEDAVRLAAAVGADGALAAPSLLTRAWALYKLDRVEDAERAFSEFASRYPRLPERGEAQLMAAQALLEMGRAADAERIFKEAADSTAAEIAALRGQTAGALGDFSRALVQARAAALLVAADPAGGKTMALHDSLQPGTALAAVATQTDVPLVAATPAVLVPIDVAARLDSAGAAGTAPLVRRVALAPASATTHPQAVAARAQALAGADAAVAVASERLDEQLAAQERAVALLARLAATLDGDTAAMAALAGEYRGLADSLARLDQLMTAAEARLRELLTREIQATRELAAENARTADSLRSVLAAATPEDREAIEAEATTAAAYLEIAQLADSGLGNAIARHPTFVMRDSVRARGERARALLAEIEGSYEGARRGVADALAALRGGDGPGARAARQALTDTETRRTAVEGELVAAVTAELSARADEMVATLQRDTEAAQFGTASAAFFQAIEGTRTVGRAAPAGRAPRERR